MKTLFLAAFLAVICAQTESQGLFNSLPNPFGFLGQKDNTCGRDSAIKFRNAVNDFTVPLIKRAAFYSKNHFIISPYTIWLSLASLAEYADEKVQLEMFSALNLPLEKCARDQFYKLAVNLEIPGNDVLLDRTRALAIDDQAIVNEGWKTFSDKTNILKYLPISFDQQSFEKIFQTMGMSSAETIPLGGHSIVLDRLRYDGLWTSAFADGRIERGPFYNDLGEKIATVDYMKMKKRVRFAHIPIINAKVLELPVGLNGRYTMLLTMGIKDTAIQKIIDLLMSSILLRIMSTVTSSFVPIEVAIPKFLISNAFDVRPMLEDVGFSKVFSDPAATRDVSDPPAQPFSYLQRVSINITNASLGTGSEEPNFLNNNNMLSNVFNMASDSATGLASAVGRSFIANKPFMFTLIETKNRVPVFTGVYSYPDEAESQQ